LSTSLPLSSDETERLAALRRYEILDTPGEEAFDRIARTRIVAEARIEPRIRREALPAVRVMAAA
jgi:hypothetical protein